MYQVLFFIPSNRAAVLSLPVCSQMEFIDVSQMSFIHDLGPKGLWAFFFPLIPSSSRHMYKHFCRGQVHEALNSFTFTMLSYIYRQYFFVSLPGKGWSISVRADIVSLAWTAAVTARPATAGPNGAATSVLLLSSSLSLLLLSQLLSFPC